MSDNKIHSHVNCDNYCTEQGCPCGCHSAGRIAREPLCLECGERHKPGNTCSTPGAERVQELERQLAEAREKLRLETAAIKLAEKASAEVFADNQRLVAALRQDEETKV